MLYAGPNAAELLDGRPRPAGAFLSVTVRYSSEEEKKSLFRQLLPRARVDGWGLLLLEWFALRGNGELQLAKRRKWYVRSTMNGRLRVQRRLRDVSFSRCIITLKY